MSNKRLYSWCQSILPANYHQIKDKTTRIQSFFEEQLPNSISQRIQVINTTESEIVVAVDDAAITNYLRLHQRELQQQLFETFSTWKTLKFKTMPEAVLNPDIRRAFRPPEQVSGETVETIKRSANFVEDSDLKQALLALAERLKS